MQQVWKDVLRFPVKHCFEKCGFKKSDADLMKKKDEEDPGCLNLVHELCLDLYVDEYVESVPTAKFSFGTKVLVWRQESQFECIDIVTRSKADCKEVASKENKKDKKSSNRSIPNIMETLSLLGNLCQSQELHNENFKRIT